MITNRAEYLEYHESMADLRQGQRSVPLAQKGCRIYGEGNCKGCDYQDCPLEVL